MNTTLKIVGISALTALWFGAGFAAGWRSRQQSTTFPPVTAELIVDTKNRPTALQQFITLPDGQTLQHGQQFKWEWNDQPAGCTSFGLQIQCEDYHAGSSRGFSAWNESLLPLAPGKPVHATTLTKPSDER